MLRIVIFTQNTMASIVATRQILFKNHEQIIAIVLASQIRGESLWKQAKTTKKLIKNTSWNFVIYKIIESKLYNALLFFHKLLRSKKYKDGTAMSIADLAERYSINVIRTNNLSDNDFLKDIVLLKPDYIFCIVGQLLKKNVFEILGNKLLNAHGSYLPEYRGPAQYFWYLLDKQKQFGVTVHFMDAGLDTGKIIFQQKFDFNPSISAYKLHFLLATKFGTMLNNFIERFGKDESMPVITQDEQKATSTHFPTKEDMRNFKKEGHHLVSITDFFRCI